MACIWAKDTCTVKVSEVPRDHDLSIPRVQALTIAGLPIVSQTFKISSFLSHDWLGDPLAVPPEWSSLHIAPPATEVLDYLKRVAVNGQRAHMFKIRDIVNRLKPINKVQSVGHLGVK